MTRYRSRVPLRIAGACVSVPWPIAFAGLFFFATFSRAVLMSVLPLKACALLGDAQAVSVLYFGAGAATVSIGTAWVLSVTWWGRLGRRHGLRRLLTSGFVAISAISMLVGLCAGWPWVALTLLVWNALAATALDGAGNVPFVRAVRPFERAEITGVYLTHRDIAQLGAPGLFAMLLAVFPLSAVFFASGSWMLGAAFLSRYIPRRM